MSKPDINYRSWADGVGRSCVGETIDPRSEGKPCSDFDDLAKFSHEASFCMQDCHILSDGTHRENAIDMNRGCRSVFVRNTYVEAGRQNAITIKGGCHGVVLSDVEIGRAGGHTDIDLGNWSDQSQELTTNVVLERISRRDGQPVRVRVLWADRPTVIDSNVKLTVYPRWLIWIWFAIFRLIK